MSVNERIFFTRTQFFPGKKWAAKVLSVAGKTTEKEEEDGAERGKRAV